MNFKIQKGNMFKNVKIVKKCKECKDDAIKWCKIFKRYRSILFFCFSKAIHISQSIN